MPSHRKEFRRSTAVFIGEVVKIESPTVEMRENLPDGINNQLGDLIFFRVIKSWKGSRTSQIVWTHATHELCIRWKFQVGQKFLVYVRKVKGIKIGAEFCSRTRPLDTEDKDELKELKELDHF
jgi:hypothetical protein